MRLMTGRALTLCLAIIYYYFTVFYYYLGWFFVFSINSAVWSIRLPFRLYGSERVCNASRKRMSRPGHVSITPWRRLLVWQSRQGGACSCGSHGMAEQGRILTRYHGRPAWFFVKLKNNIFGRWKHCSNHSANTNSAIKHIKPNTNWCKWQAWVLLPMMMMCQALLPVSKSEFFSVTIIPS